MEEFLDEFSSYSLAEKVVGFVAIVALVFVGFYMALYRPLTSEIDSQESQLEKLTKEKRDLESLKKSQAKVLDQVKKLQAEIVLAEDKLPSSGKIPRLLKLLHDKAKTAGLKISNFQRETNVSKKYYIEIPVQMELQGTFGELAKFLRYVDNMNRIVNIKNISLNRKQESRGELTVSAKATTYRYKEPQKKKDLK